MDQKYFGFVSIVGRANVGKSTFLNYVLGEKLSIITPKAHTTRAVIRGIYNDSNSQIVFLDTPGLHKVKNVLEKEMQNSIFNSLYESDVVLFMIDKLNITEEEDKLLEFLLSENKKIFLIINKIDKFLQERVKDAIPYLQQKTFAKEVFAICAKEGLFVSSIIEAIKKELKLGGAVFPTDILSDQTERFFVSEIVREKLFLYMNKEIPYGVSVLVESFSYVEKRDIYHIHCKILCKKESHKAMIIGNQGKKIKGIGISARYDIENFLGSKVNLKLFVKVDPDWDIKNGIATQNA